MITITDLTETCSACPTQFEGKTSDGKDVYIRYRFGHLYITVNKEYIYSQSIGSGLDGVISLSQIKNATKDLAITWPQ
jgi:hypothetical protein